MFTFTLGLFLKKYVTTLDYVYTKCILKMVYTLCVRKRETLIDFIQDFILLIDECTRFFVI